MANNNERDMLLQMFMDDDDIVVVLAKNIFAFIIMAFAESTNAPTHCSRKAHRHPRLSHRRHTLIS